MGSVVSVVWDVVWGEEDGPIPAHLLYTSTNTAEGPWSTFEPDFPDLGPPPGKEFIGTVHPNAKFLEKKENQEPA